MRMLLLKQQQNLQLIRRPLKPKWQQTQQQLPKRLPMRKLLLKQQQNLQLIRRLLRLKRQRTRQ